MKAIVAIVAVITALAAPSAFACQLQAGKSLAEHLAADLKRQTSLVNELSHEAESIVVGQLERLDQESGSATVKVLRTIKGTAEQRLRLSWNTDRVVVGCSASAYFQSINLSIGTRYLVYLKGNQILRAGPVRRPPDELSFRQELRLVTPRQAPNNSSKPTPLRGAA